MTRDQIARRIVRLYPRRWRERYEAEILALIEDSGLDARRAIDLTAGMLHEWAPLIAGSFRSLAANRFAVVVGLVCIWGLGCLLALVATELAILLRHIPTPARVWFESGQKIVAPPLLPSSLARWAPLLGFVILARSVLGGFELPDLGKKIGAIEFSVWSVLLLAASACAQWSSMVNHYETGLAPESLASIWGNSALSVVLSMQFLWMSSTLASDLMRRARERRDTENGRLRNEVPRGPLRLS